MNDDEFDVMMNTVNHLMSFGENSKINPQTFMISLMLTARLMSQNCPDEYMKRIDVVLDKVISVINEGGN